MINDKSKKKKKKIKLLSAAILLGSLGLNFVSKRFDVELNLLLKDAIFKL